MATTSTTHSQKGKYQLQWNDDSLIDIPAELLTNSTTFSNMFIDVDKERVIHCCSKRIKGADVKLYFQHYQSLLANQALPTDTLKKVPGPPTSAKLEATIDPIKLMDLLLVANYFDDSTMLSAISRRIITTIHNVLWKARRNKTEMVNKMKNLREKFSSLPPEIQNLISDDLEKYVAIKGPYHVVRHVSLPSGRECRMRDWKYQVRRNKRKTNREYMEKRERKSKEKKYKIKDILITNLGEIIAALEFTKLVPRTGINSVTFRPIPLDRLPPEVGAYCIELYDELNPRQATILNELPLYSPGMNGGSYPAWRYNYMGGLTADGIVWVIELKLCSDFINELIQYFYLPNGLRIKSKNRIDDLISHRQMAVIRPIRPSESVIPTNSEDDCTPLHIINIPTGRIISTIPNFATIIRYDPTGQYAAGIEHFYNGGSMVELYEIENSKLLFRSMINTTDSPLTELFRPLEEEVKVDSYRQLIYIIMTKCNDNDTLLFTLVILNFSGQMVARYRIPSLFLIYFGPDILITVESNQRSTNVTLCSAEILNYPQFPIDMTPLQTMPRIKSTIPEYVIVERDVSNGWRPLKILSKIPTSINSVAPQVIFSPNGYYLLVAPPTDGKLSDFTSPTVAYTRLHSVEEIEMIKGALLGPPETDVGPSDVKADEYSKAEASTSSTP